MRKNDIEKCLKDKDRRIKELETKFNNIRFGIVTGLMVFLVIISVIGFGWVSVHIMHELPSDMALNQDGYPYTEDDSSWYVMDDVFGIVAFPLLLIFAWIGLITVLVLLWIFLSGDEDEG